MSVAIGEKIEKILDAVKAVIFDLDGTLYDNRGIAFRLVMSRPLDAFLAKAERTVRRGMKGVDFYSPEKYYDAFFKQMTLYTRKTEAYVRDWYFQKYMPGMCAVLERHYTVRPGVEKLFSMFKKADIEYAVYSDYPETAARLDAIGLNSAECGRLYGPDNFGALKPAQRPFISIAQDMGSLPAETLVVGDREDTDVAGALACGMKFVLIHTEKNSKRKEADTGEWFPHIPWDLFFGIFLEHTEKSLEERHA